ASCVTTPLGTAGHGVDSAPAPAGRFARQDERRIIEKVDRFTADLEPRDAASVLASGQQAATNSRITQVDLRVGAQRNEATVLSGGLHAPRSTRYNRIALPRSAPLLTRYRAVSRG